MAENQPQPGAAATGPASQATPQQPEPGQAGNQPEASTLTFDSLSEEQRNYLKGQGIDGSGPLTQEALTKVVDHARSSQKTLAERQAELDKLRNGQSGEQGPTGTPSNEPGGASGAQSSTQPQSGLDELTAYQLAATLSQQYPKLNEQLSDGSFYEEMQKEGYPIAKADGGVNLASIQKFAARRTKEIELEEKLAEANKPGQIPDANAGGNSQTIDPNGEMDVTMARRIVLTDPSNARREEAEKFLQEYGRKK